MRKNRGWGQRISAMSMAAVLALTVGCSNSADPTAPSANKANVNGPKPKVIYWTNRPAADIERIKTDILNEVQKEVDLEIVVIPAEYENKIRIAISGGNAPDMFDVDGVYTANYAYTGALLPLDKYWDNADFDDYVPSSKEKTTYNGKKYAASLFDSSVVLYYNKDHFAKAGITNVPDKVSNAWTFDQYLDAAQKLTIRDASGKITQYGAIPYGWLAPDVTNEGASFTHFLNIWNHGAEVLDPKYTTAKGYLNSPKTIAVLQEYQDYFQKYKVSPLESITKDQSGFENGKLSMYISNISTSYALKTKYPDLKFGVMPLPKGEKQYGSSGGWNVGISAKTKVPDAAWKVVHALTGKEGHKKFAEMFNFIPSRKSALDSIPTLKEYPFNLAREQMLNARARPVTPAYAEISPIFAEMMSAIAYGGNPTELANKAADNIDKVLSKYAK
ncbi:extracellular solute-binding protein [Paenibacillus cremeus]|uniref:Extracellular solute-binding protein n=1 Tax=Paenibacillus cremeus TaxID=2163881 RepID=A0A559KGM5_9BACL|nr:extracellular solute-binding protein [Paenibacillus cremeus]TVY11280.1 extracellular solute-binding protein [Paenibacillus cremeus]